MTIADGLLALAILVITVLIVGAWSLAMMTAFNRMEEREELAQEPHPPPIIYLPMMDSSGEGAAATAEMYRQYYDSEGA